MALFAAACATSTPYAPADRGGGYGFSEQRIEANRYRVMFRGNSSTTRETVENYLLYRAAELTIANGYDHFLIVENDTEANTTYRSTTTGFGAGYGPGWGPAFYGRYRYGYAFPYYAWGWGWGFPADTYTQEYTRYSAVAFVLMQKGPKPDNEPRAFTARDVIENLQPFVAAQRPDESI
ncbi:MAG: hypothetical protein GC152_01060 [Alphaproteobacteria bacterium]|nr:hypothetical protein [Alphaproteobacteria bacterium]